MIELKSIYCIDLIVMDADEFIERAEEECMNVVFIVIISKKRRK